MLYASIGPELSWYDVDVEAATLTKRGSVRLPTGVQYVWPHPSRRYLYVASSNGGPGRVGNRHDLSAFRIEAGSGALVAHGAPRSLPARPINLCIDATGGFALTAYNNPSMVTVHRLEADGGIGDEVRQPASLDAGIYAHQIRMTPSNRAAILVTRGNDATAREAEDPGALKVLAMSDGVLTSQSSIAPGNGFGFGPRHLDFHPTQPWVYVSIERQNQLQLFDLGSDDTLGAMPRFVSTTLPERAHVGARQHAGAVHVHPNGDFVYVSNRSEGDGEDSIAVYAIDRASGEPRLIQHADPQSVHVRTFSIDPSGRLLVTASIQAYPARNGDSSHTVPAALSVFRIGSDGTLDFVRKYDVDTGDETMFWSGMVAPA